MTDYDRLYERRVPLSGLKGDAHEGATVYALGLRCESLGIHVSLDYASGFSSMALLAPADAKALSEALGAAAAAAEAYMAEHETCERTPA